MSNKEFFFEDLFNNNKIDSINLNEKLLELVKNHKVIYVKGLNSAERHIVYRSIYYPLKFEKIIENEEEENKEENKKENKEKDQKEKENNEENENIRNVTIKIYNSKIKQNKDDEELYKNIEKEILSFDKNNSSDSELESDIYTISNSDDTEESYITEDEEQLVKIENLTGQILENINKNTKDMKNIKLKLNLILLLNISGWIMLYILEIKKINNIINYIN